MATKETVIQAVTPPQVHLTTQEADILREQFSAELANVISARTNPNLPSLETNNPSNPPSKKGGKKGGKKGKKGARKATKKKAARKSTKKSGKKK